MCTAHSKLNCFGQQKENVWPYHVFISILLVAFSACSKLSYSPILLVSLFSIASRAQPALNPSLGVPFTTPKLNKNKKLFHLFACLWNKQTKPKQTQSDKQNQNPPKHTNKHLFCLFVQTVYPDQTKPFQQ